MLTMFEKAVLFFIDKIPGIGEVKLRKGLFLIDSLYYALYKKSLTGISYIKEKQGPVPDNKAYKKLIDILDKPYIINEYELRGDYEKSSYHIDKKLFNEDLQFNESDEKLLMSVVNYISNKSGTKLSKLTHGYVYNNTPMRSKMPLSKVVEFRINEEKDTKEPNNIKELLEPMREGLLKDANFLQSIRQ